MNQFGKLVVASWTAFGLASSVHAQAHLEWLAIHGSVPNQPDEARFTAVDGAGNVHVALLSANSSGYNDVEVAKYSATGVWQWTRRFDTGVTYNDYPTGIAVAANGDVCVCGIRMANPKELFVVRYDAGGNFLWSTVSGAPGTGSDTANDLAIDSQGNVVIAGTAPNANGWSDMLVQAYSPLGALLWDTRIDGASSREDHAYAILIDSSGSIFVAGSVGTATFEDAAIARLDANGVLQWLRALPQPLGDAFLCIASDRQGGVLAGGFTQFQDMFSTYDRGLVAHCDGAGTYRWVDAFPQGPTYNWTHSVLMDQAGIAWAFHDADQLGSPHALVTRISPAGVRLSATAVPLSTRSAGLVAGNAGQVFASAATNAFGSVYGPSDFGILAQFDTNGILNWTREFAMGAAGIAPVAKLQAAPQARVVLGGVASYGSPASGWEGFVIQSDVSESPHGYCTAKTNSLGCVPRTAFVGMPDASASAGFRMRVDQVRNQKSGMFLYGVNGAAATPFGGGTLCVQQPIRRTPGVHSGGSATGSNCSGVYSIDMNAFAKGMLGGSPAPELVIPGTRVWMQAWGRDNGFPAPNNLALSGGLTYVVLP